MFFSIKITNTFSLSKTHPDQAAAVNKLRGDRYRIKYRRFTRVADTPIFFCGEAIPKHPGLGTHPEGVIVYLAYVPDEIFHCFIIPLIYTILLLFAGHKIDFKKWGRQVMDHWRIVLPANGYHGKSIIMK